MKRHIALFVGLVFLTLAAVSAVNFVKADVFHSNDLFADVAGTATEATDDTFASGSGSAMRYFRVIWLAGATGWVGFSGTPYVATAASNPVYMRSDSEVVVDSGRTSPIIHIQGNSNITVRVEGVDIR